MKFSPVLLPKPWGGDALWRVLRKGAAGDDRMGEAWELSDRPEAPVRVAEGPLAGIPLPELLAAHAAAIFGEFLPKNGFPLLYKFIAAREKLSVQVHPGAGSPLGEAKTECWYVVDAAPGASLIVGVDPGGRGRDETLALLKSPDCERVLRRLPARRGDAFFIPAGTVHAITEGLLLYEVQQNSDTTFRLYDWGRTDAEGRPRALHIAEAGEVADVEAREGFHIPPLRVEPRPSPGQASTHTEDFLVVCPYFALVKWSGFKDSAARGKGARLETGGRFRVISVVSGAFTLRGEDGQDLSLGLGETALVPACHASVILEAASPDAEAIVSFVPDLERDVRAPLRAAGHSEAAIRALSGPAGVAV